MSYQFLRVELFSRKGKSGRGTAFVFDEVERQPSASLHVPEPGKPVVVHGLDVPALRTLHDTRAASARATTKAGKTRSIRSDQNTLAGVVLSYPVPMAEYRQSADARRDFERWQERSVAWLRGQYGDKLVSVVRHEDESYPHLHAYVLPDAADVEMRASALHPGFLAKPARDPAKMRRPGTSAVTAPTKPRCGHGSMTTMSRSPSPAVSPGWDQASVV